MSKYNFDKLANRQNTNSLKWDEVPGTLPMWVADMDFETLPEIKEALLKRVNIGAYGYSIIPDSYFEAFQNWWDKYHNYRFDTKYMIYSSGVVAALSSMVRSLTNIGDKVLVLPPVYNIFYNSIINNKREIEVCHLDYKVENGCGTYSLDFNKLEDKMSDPKVTLLIFCNPHNPTGHIWTKEELYKVSELALKYNVKVISDEIHCDLGKPGTSYIPFASVNPKLKSHLVTCLAASKAFNIAGLQSACIIAEDEGLRYKVWRGINNDEVGEPNFFAVDANIAALTYGRDYLNELNEYIYNNKQYFVKNFLNKYPALIPVMGDATYLMYVDISHYFDNSIEAVKEIKEKTGLFLSEGVEYDASEGHKFIRINLATSLENVKDAINRLSSVLDQK